MENGLFGYVANVGDMFTGCCDVSLYKEYQITSTQGRRKRNTPGLAFFLSPYTAAQEDTSAATETTGDHRKAPAHRITASNNQAASLVFFVFSPACVLLRDAGNMAPDYF